MSRMRFVVTVLSLLLPAVVKAGVVSVSSWSAAEYADTEVSAISVQMSPKGLKVVIE